MTAILFKDATIVTMDEGLGDFVKGDLLVDGDRIAAVGPGLASERAERIDAANRVVVPGLINAHLHTWQTGLRGLAFIVPLAVLRRRASRLATLFGPEDLYYAQLLGGWNQIDCGTTTLGDWCHNNPTTAHTNAALDGLIKSQVRAVYFHGSPKPDPSLGSGTSVRFRIRGRRSTDAWPAPCRTGKVGDAGAGDPWPALLNARRVAARLPAGARVRVGRLHASGRR